MITQGGVGDLEDIGKFAKPPFDLKNLSSIDRTDDLQVIARGIVNLGRPGLDNICKKLGLIFPNQHNAGNDAMAQLVCAVYIAMLEWRQRMPLPLYTIIDLPAHLIMGTLSTSTRRPLLIGSRLHCERCSDDHLPGVCHWKVGYCLRCLAWNKHATTNCPFGADNEKLEERRQSNHAHTIRVCRRQGHRAPEYVSLIESGLSRIDHILEPLVPRDQQVAAAVDASDVSSTPPIPGSSKGSGDTTPTSATTADAQDVRDTMIDESTNTITTSEQMTGQTANRLEEQPQGTKNEDDGWTTVHRKRGRPSAGW